MVIAALTWPAARWLFWPGYLSSYDGAYHLTRMIEVDSLVRQGILYPRWFPDFGLGHGYPIFTFFPPFGYLLTEAAALVVRDLPLALQVSMAASFVVSGWGMYLLARECCAPRPAALAVSAFYVYFPYHLQDTYTRGGMPELWAMAWLPWLVWAQLRATREPSSGRIGAAAVLAAAEIGTHNILAAFMLPASLAIGLALSHPKRRFVVASALCTGLGILLASGYWLPAIAEAPLTHVKQLAGDWLPQHAFDLANLVEPGFYAPYGDQTYKLTALEAGLVLVQSLGFAVRGLLARRFLPEVGLSGLMAALVFLLTRWSVPFWMKAPLMGYIQFPWRLLILIGFVAAVMLAVLAWRRRFSWLLIAPVAAAIAVSSLGRVPEGRFATGPVLDARVLEAQEYGSALDGVAIESEYQPATSSPDLVKASQGKRLPGDATPAARLSVNAIAQGPTAFEASVDAQEPGALRLQPFYFPGWRARLDGRAWPLRAAAPAGLIEAEIPSGRHKLELAYEGSAIETGAGLVSGLTLLGLAVWVFRRRPLALGASVVGLTVLAVVLWHPPGGRAEVNPSSWAASPDQKLVGYSGPRVTERGIETDLWWLFGTPREASFDFVLRDGMGREARRTPAEQATTMPYEYIAANELLRRRYTLTAPLGLPAGSYTLSLEAGGSSTSLGDVELGPPSQQGRRLDARFQDRATLVSYDVERVKPRPGLATDPVPGRADGTAYPGDFLLLSLLWRSERTMDQNYVVFVHLVDADGRTWANHDNQPNATLQATGSWVPGQTILDRHLLKLPEATPPGVYRVEVGMYHVDERGYRFLPLASGGNSVVFGSVKVRSRTAAPSARPAAVWPKGMALLGWSRDGDRLTFEWQATGEPARDYTLFVHLSDSVGKVVAQADGPPRGGAFPTGLWESGDRISDAHTLRDAPAGSWRLTIGWYDPRTGERLRTANGQDELDLGALET